MCACMWVIQEREITCGGGFWEDWLGEMWVYAM